VPHLLASFDKWRGTATAPEACEAAVRAAQRLGWTAEACPLSDGGEGFLEVLGGPNRTAQVDTVIGPRRVGWRLDGDRAVIEMALADGLELVGGPDDNDPLVAGTRGTGQLIVAAIEAGARQVVVGLGGSASTDGGLGCVEVLRDHPRLKRVELVAACDIRSPFGAATDFAEQKGATAAQRRLLEARLGRVAEIYEVDFGLDVRDIPGAGAAGGLGGGLAALGAALVGGFDLASDLCDLVTRIVRADLVVTGEGWLDGYSFEGKPVGEIAAMSSHEGKRALAVVGGAEPEALERAAQAGLDVAVVSELYGDSEARSNTLACIESAVVTQLGS
jgi:glycerate 2-kinase